MTESWRSFCRAIQIRIFQGLDYSFMIKIAPWETKNLHLKLLLELPILLIQRIDTQTVG